MVLQMGYSLKEHGMLNIAEGGAGAAPNGTPALASGGGEATSGNNRCNYS